jgi:hypothetical protein
MIYIIIILVIASVATTIKLWDSDNHPGLVGLAIITCAISSVLLIVIVINNANFKPEMARRAMVIQSVERLGCHASHDVLESATSLNEETAINRVWNHRFVGDPFYPDGWDTVSVITIPDCK